MGLAPGRHDAGHLVVVFVSGPLFNLLRVKNEPSSQELRAGIVN